MGPKKFGLEFNELNSTLKNQSFGETVVTAWHSALCLVALSKNFKRINLAPNFSELHAWVKKCHFSNFSERATARMAVPSKTLHSIWKILFVLGADEYIRRLEDKIRQCLFFYLKKFQNNSVSELLWVLSLFFCGFLHCEKFKFNLL